MEWPKLFIAGGLGLFTSLIVLDFLTRRAARHSQAPSRVERHHTHRQPVPRTGGLAFALAMLATLVTFSLYEGPGFYQTNERWVVCLCSLAMFGLGFWDDFISLGAKKKLVGQIAIASLAYALGIGILHFRVPFTDQILDLGHWAYPVTLLWLVGMTNLINLIDGVDGLAGGICLMLTGLLIYVSGNADMTPVLATTLFGSLIGFLRYNFPPAKIYMGDGGAYFLGFYIGCSTILTSHKGTIFAALVAPLFVLALPIIDTSLAILRRGLRGLPLFRPDKKHIHHRLLAQGYSRRRVVLSLYVFTAFFLVLGVTMFTLRGQFFPLFVGVGGLVIVIFAGQFNFSREWLSIGRVIGNSLETRGEIQYAMQLTQWLALEGRRAENLASIAEDTFFIARKLGFSSARILLEDDEKKWSDGDHGQPGQTFRHDYPGQRYCYLELKAVCENYEPKKKKPEQPAKNESTYFILSDLLAEGWVKAVSDWQRLHSAPLRFDATKVAPALSDAMTPASPSPR